MRREGTLILTLVLGLWLAVRSEAAVQPAQWRPVDQAVGDLDPLATSFRRSRMGGALQLQRSRPQLYRLGSATGRGPRIDPVTGLTLPGGYLYAAPGVRAYLPRPDYLVAAGRDNQSIGFDIAPSVDGAYHTLIPAGTVFDLVPRSRMVQQPPVVDDDWVDHRIDARLDLRLDTRLDDQRIAPRQAVPVTRLFRPHRIAARRNAARPERAPERADAPGPAAHQRLPLPDAIRWLLHRELIARPGDVRTSKSKGE